MVYDALDVSTAACALATGRISARKSIHEGHTTLVHGGCLPPPNPNIVP